MDIPCDVLWLIIKTYLRIYGGDFLYRDKNNGYNVFAFTNTKKFGSYFSSDLILFRSINKSFKRTIEKYTTIRKHNLRRSMKVLYMNYPETRNKYFY